MGSTMVSCLARNGFRAHFSQKGCTLKKSTSGALEQGWPCGFNQDRKPSTVRLLLVLAEFPPQAAAQADSRIPPAERWQTKLGAGGREPWPRILRATSSLGVRRVALVWGFSPEANSKMPLQKGGPPKCVGFGVVFTETQRKTYSNGCFGGIQWEKWEVPPLFDTCPNSLPIQMS